MVNPERFSPTSRQAESAVASSRVNASVQKPRDVSGNADGSDEDDDGSRQTDTRPFGLKGEEFLRLSAQCLRLVAQDARCGSYLLEFCLPNANFGFPVGCVARQSGGMLACRDPPRSSIISIL